MTRRSLWRTPLLSGRARLAMDPDESVRATTVSRETAAAPGPATPSREAEPAKLRMTSPAPIAMRPAMAESESGGRDLAREAVLAIQTAMTDVLTDQQKELISTRIPAGRMGMPDEIAAAVVYLASNEAAYLTGQTLHINGGMAMI